ncbi:MAG TPA: hypothetical protein VJT31_00410 [Rugosimonospora sp.]|nr:hypothetical protein [Rugosimonospora sp.]
MLLMHGIASTSGCAGGMPMPPPQSGHAATALMASPPHAVSDTPPLNSPLWTLPRGAGGDMCVALPASPEWVAVLILLLVASGARLGDPRQATPPRRAPAWRAPPDSGAALLTRIGVSRT